MSTGGDTGWTRGCSLSLCAASFSASSLGGRRTTRPMDTRANAVPCLSGACLVCKSVPINVLRSRAPIEPARRLLPIGSIRGTKGRILHTPRTPAPRVGVAPVSPTRHGNGGRSPSTTRQKDAGRVRDVGGDGSALAGTGPGCGPRGRPLAATATASGQPPGKRASAAWPREYWTGLFARGFGLCYTTHAEWAV